jgi:chromosome segregation ATPase
MSLRHQVLEIILQHGQHIPEQTLLEITTSLQNISAQQDPTHAQDLQRDLDAALQQNSELLDRIDLFRDEIEYLEGDLEAEFQKKTKLVEKLYRQSADLESTKLTLQDWEEQYNHLDHKFQKMKHYYEIKQAPLACSNAYRVRHLIQTYNLPEPLPRQFRKKEPETARNHSHTVEEDTDPWGDPVYTGTSNLFGGDDDDY